MIKSSRGDPLILGMIDREKKNETDLNLKALDLKLGLNERCVGRFAEFV